ncbi:GTP-binding protein TypA [Trifolium pratense]|uniref:GTP-binding protein TypA n=1 Tax=Trifolium pratense TaxID=57577 RepID=A0A2K3P633_TRIPR|nr:GTP-binding protein TypA [Trifolium pratense]
MVKGILLVVDSVEGPMPQTRFVLKKALGFGHAVVIVVKKIDRSSARPEFVVNSTFELFIELNPTDEHSDFQVTSTEYKGHKGRITIDRLEAGVLEKGMEVKVCVEEDSIGQAFREVQIQEGKYVTSRNLRDILYHELERNLAIKVEKMVKQPIHSLSNTETIDVTDAVGSNIRIDSRGPEVMRIVPRLNEVRF